MFLKFVVLFHFYPLFEVLVVLLWGRGGEELLVQAQENREADDAMENSENHRQKQHLEEHPEDRRRGHGEEANACDEHERVLELLRVIIEEEREED